MSICILSSEFQTRVKNIEFLVGGKINVGHRETTMIIVFHGDPR